jgi:hypothetical protein
MTANQNRWLHFDIFADYHQFSLTDDREEMELPDWADQALTNRVVVFENVVHITTARNMSVPVLIELVGTLPPVNTADLETWDHVIECSVGIPSGSMVLWSNHYWPEAPRIKVSPGTYQLRICHGGLDTLSDDGLIGSDVYLILMAPGPAIDLKILKQAPSPMERGG